jgi:hypothetical protein
MSDLPADLNTIHLFERENLPLCRAVGVSGEVEVWGELMTFDEAEVTCNKCIGALAGMRYAKENAR